MVVFFNDTATTEIYTLSLHDALPSFLDQKIVAGIGNIYADEILYDARLHPRRKASTLTKREWEVLYGAIVENLRAGIEHRGDRKSTRLNSSHANISYAVFCLKTKTST